MDQAALTQTHLTRAAHAARASRVSGRNDNVVRVPNHLMRAQTGDFALSRRIVFTLLLLLLLSPTALLAQDDDAADSSATGATSGAVVISEIHYDPADKRARIT